jgi:hypothetical protein
MYGDQPKIADFGLAKTTNERIPYNNKIITSWWRPPELLAYDISPKPKNKIYYGPEVDIWSMGLIIWQIFVGKYPIKGDTEQLILEDIILTIGLTEEQNHIFKRILVPSRYDKIKDNSRILIKDKFRGLQDDAVRFILKMLVPEPSFRPAANMLLGDPFLANYECNSPKIEYQKTKIDYTEVVDRPMRVQAINEIRDLCHNIPNDTFFLAVDIFDRLFNRLDPDLNTEDVLPYANASYTLAFKITELSNSEINAGIELKREMQIMSSLDFHIYRPTINVLFPYMSKNQLADCVTNNVSVEDIHSCAVSLE